MGIRRCVRCWWSTSGKPGPVLAAMDRIADALCELVSASAALGVDGIYYAALGGERHFFTDEEFYQWIAPFDRRILQTARQAGVYTFLHICKENLNMQRYKDYGGLVDVVNWGVYETDFPLEAGRELFPQAAIMGAGQQERSSGGGQSGRDRRCCAQDYPGVRTYRLYPWC